MKQLIGFLLAGLLLLSACGVAEGEESGVEIHEAWARAAAQEENSAVYLILHNHTPQADLLTGASTDVAESVEIHESQVDANGVITMELQASVALDTDAEIEFKPGGLHFMLVNLRQELKVGDEFIFTIHFRDHEDIAVPVLVLEAAVMDGGGTDDHQAP